MAPEQAASATLTPAADVYALGVVLFQAVSGRLPFEGAAAGILLAKQMTSAPRLSEVIDDVPPELDELCAGLLERDPAARPSASDVAAALGAPLARSTLPPAPRARAATPPPPDDASGAIGREEEIQRIEERVRDRERSGLAVVVVQAPSGLGKTTVVENAARRLAAQGYTVLRTCCYEREQSPYEALDGLGRSLTRSLTAAGLRARDDVDEALGDLAALAPSIAETATRAPPAGASPRIQRERAASALRFLLVELGAAVPLLVLFDDLQWLDADGHTLFSEVLLGPEAPPLALVGTLRPGASLGAELIRGLERAAASGGGRSFRRIDLGPLPETSARALARAHVEAARADAPELECASSPSTSTARGRPCRRCPRSCAGVPSRWAASRRGCSSSWPSPPDPCPRPF
jgi:hypothetical protein